ncbi:hypothetical protein D3C75_683170 [compost metagenome]
MPGLLRHLFHNRAKGLVPRFRGNTLRKRIRKPIHGFVFHGIGRVHHKQGIRCFIRQQRCSHRNHRALTVRNQRQRIFRVSVADYIQQIRQPPGGMSVIMAGRRIGKQAIQFGVNKLNAERDWRLFQPFTETLVAPQRYQLVAAVLKRAAPPVPGATGCNLRIRQLLVFFQVVVIITRQVTQRDLVIVFRTRLSTISPVKANYRRTTGIRVSDFTKLCFICLISIFFELHIMRQI